MSTLPPAMNAIDLTALMPAVGAVCTLLVGALLMWTDAWHGHLSRDSSHGVQKQHQRPTPRIGGLAILVGAWLSWWPICQPEDRLLVDMWLAGLPAFAFGFAEDITKRVGVRERLLATMASGVLAWWLTDASLTRLDVWGLDRLLAWLPFSVLFTAFAAGGLANAYNIIDGFHGLAAGVALLCLAAFAGIAWWVGDSGLARICLMLGGVTLGFLVLNYPWGRIFLGDGGAYLLGFWLAWVAVLLPARNPSVSPWCSLLVCAYPITEVLFSILRRLLWRRTSPWAPDRLHLHHLLKHRLVDRWLTHWSPPWRNAATAPLLWWLAALPAAAAIALRESTQALALAWLVFALVYGLAYRLLARLAPP